MRTALLLGAVAVAACATSPDSLPPSSVAEGPPASTAPLDWREVPALTRASRIAPVVLWDRGAARPRMISGAFPVAASSPEAAARSFLAGNADLFALRSDGSDLVLVATRQGLAGTYLRFDQHSGGLPVFDAQVVVAVSAGGDEVRMVNLAHRGVVAPPAAGRDIGAVAALDLARRSVGRPVESAMPTVVRGIIAGPPSSIAYKVVIPATSAAATFDVGVTASGAIAWSRNDDRFASGEGLVFDVNPVSSTGNLTFTDNNGATTPALDAARFSVVLPNLDGTGVLRGSWVDAQRLTNANRATDATLHFDFDRSDGHFEEVMAYYHLDRVQERIQALGFTNVNHRVQVAIVDALTADNSFYSAADKEIRYGTGGVNDAEDGEIIVHEYGHSCQDNQVPGFGGGDEGSMGEGFGDYLAGSFEATLAPAAGHPQVADPACIGDWDATSYSTDNPPCLRRLDGTKHDPEAADGEVHDDGEMWSAALWASRSEITANVADQDVIEAHFLLSTNESFDSAANAILMTDTTVFAGAHVAALRHRLYHQGLLRTAMPPSALTDVTASDTVDLRNPTTNNLYANNLDDTQTYTHAGAGALRIHFATLDTQAGTGVSCLENGCDNVYIYDGAGDLYQILHGQSQTNLTSVTIPGDTVQIRLVTNASTQRAGYVVDRIDVLGAGIQVDAGVSDAMTGPNDAGFPDALILHDAAVLDAQLHDAAVHDAAAPDAAVDAPMGIPDIDAPVHGESPDAGGGGGSSGCGCRSTDASSGAVFALALVLVVRRRRRR